MGTPVFMFPGQSSRDPQMLERILASWEPGVALVQQASARLRRDLRDLVRSTDGFTTNRGIQISVFLTNHVYLQALTANGLDATYSLGLSLGEYNHLVHIGAIDFLDALELVDARGRLYDTAPAGKMIAVMPLDAAELGTYVEQIAGTGVLEIANFNSPTQHVVAGDPDLVDQLADLLEDEAMAMCFPVDDRLAMHTHLMDPVAEDFLPILQGASWHMPSLTYVPGINPTRRISDPSDIASILGSHVNRPVSFFAGLAHVLGSLEDAVLIEVGPKTTLRNLVRSWRAEPVFATDDQDADGAPLPSILERILL